MVNDKTVIDKCKHSYNDTKELLQLETCSLFITKRLNGDSETNFPSSVFLSCVTACCKASPLPSHIDQLTWSTSTVVQVSSKAVVLLYRRMIFNQGNRLSLGRPWQTRHGEVHPESRAPIGIMNIWQIWGQNSPGCQVYGRYWKVWHYH